MTKTIVLPADRWRAEITAAEDALAHLKAHLSTFDGLLSGGLAEVYRLPVIRDDGTVSGGVTAAELRHIKVDTVSGPMALRMAKALYQQIVRRHRQPPTRPDRLPGLVVTDRSVVIEAAQAINQAKDALRLAMGALPRVSGRNSTLLDGTDLQHLMLLQAYRHIDIVPGIPDQVSFGWTGRSRSVRQITREDAIEMVEKMGEGAESVLASRWLRALEEIDDDLLAQVKDIPPKPVCNVRYTGEDGLARWMQRPSCTMPALVQGRRLPTIRPLTTFDADAIEASMRAPDGAPSEATRSDSLLLPEPLIDAIHLYRYKPECLAAALTRRSVRLKTSHPPITVDRAHPFA